MNTRYMEFFLKIVDMGSISAASQELYISPQGLSQAVQQMEKEVGEKLFFRDGNKLFLTASGELAYNAFKKIVDVNNDMLDRIHLSRSENKRAPRRINVVAVPIIAATCLPKVIELFRKRNPDAGINVREVPPEAFFEAEEFGVDTLGIVALPSTLKDNFVRTAPEHVLINLPFSCQQEVCMSVRSSMVKQKYMTVRDMEKGQVVLFGGDIRMLSHLPEGFDDSSVAVQTRNISLCRTLIASEKNMYGFTNRLVEHYMKSKGLVSVPFVPDIPVHYGYVLNRDTENPLIKDFREILETEYEMLKKVNEE